MEEYLKYVESHSGEKHIIRQRGLAKHMSKYWKKKRINDFQESDVHAYLKTIKGRKGAKPVSWTLAANFNLIRALFAYAAKHRIIKSDMNPTLAMDCIDTGTTAEPEVMTCEEVKRMLVWYAQSESWQDMLPAIVLGVFCGVRNAERCCLAELGSLSMDNGNCAVSFPDFTRGHWNDVKGYTHAWASPEDEAATNAAAAAYTSAQKEAVTKYNLWGLYDAAAKAEGADKDAAQKTYNDAQ